MSRGILVLADDDAVLLQTYAAAFKSVGYIPMTAGGGNEVLELLHKVSPKAVVLDIQMPDIDGFAVCARLRERLGDDLPIIFLTVRDGLETLRDALQAGGDDFIMKRDTLKNIVTRVDLWARRASTGGRERRLKLLMQVKHQLGDKTPVDAINGQPVKPQLADEAIRTAMAGVEAPEGARALLRDARSMARLEYGADKREQMILLGYTLGVVESFAKQGEVQNDKLFGTWLRLLEPTGALSDMSIRKLLGDRQGLVAQDAFKAGRNEGRSEAALKLRGDLSEAWGLAMLILGRSMAPL
jgi:DNA-binding response OmpR family regulator